MTGRIKKIIKKNESRGLTFIELIVVISIFAILASVLLFRFTDFRENISVQNLAQEVALTIRQAQNNAVSGVFDARFSGNPPTYGVAFDMDKPKEFVYFLDIPDPDVGEADGVYDGNSTPVCENECLDVISLTGEGEIKEICINKYSAGDKNCDIRKLSITFTRPFPEAEMVAEVTTGGPPGEAISEADITVAYGEGTPRSVLIWKTGQISVRQPEVQ